MSFFLLLLTLACITGNEGAPILSSSPKRDDDPGVSLTGCPNKIAVSVDVSASMSLDGAFNEDQFKDVLKIAMRLYLFKDHNACVAVFAYATKWRMVMPYTRVNSATLRTKLLRAVDELVFETAYPAYYTNWEAGLRAPILAKQQGLITDIPNTLFFITNGPPTTRTSACTGPQPCDDLAQNMINAQYASQMVQSFGTKVVPMGLGTNVTDDLLAKVAGRCDPTNGCIKNTDYYHVENMRRDFADAIAKSLKMAIASKKELQELEERATNITDTNTTTDTNVTTTSDTSSSSTANTTTVDTSTDTTTTTTTTDTNVTITTTVSDTSMANTTAVDTSSDSTTTTTTTTATTTTSEPPTTTVPSSSSFVPFSPSPPPGFSVTKHKLTHQNRPPVNTIHRPAGATSTPYPKTDQQRESFKHKQVPAPPPPAPPQQQQQIVVKHEHHLFTHEATIIFIILVSVAAFLVLMAFLAIWCCAGDRWCWGNRYVDQQQEPLRFRDVRVEAGMPDTPAHLMRHSKGKFSVDGPNFNKMH